MGDTITDTRAMTTIEIETIEEILEEGVRNIGRIANAVTPTSAAAGQDATGGHVASLTEAVMGNTAGLIAISDGFALVADAIDNLAEAVREHGGVA